MEHKLRTRRYRTCFYCSCSLIMILPWSWHTGMVCCGGNNRCNVIQNLRLNHLNTYSTRHAYLLLRCAHSHRIHAHRKRMRACARITHAKDAHITRAIARMTSMQRLATSKETVTMQICNDSWFYGPFSQQKGGLLHTFTSTWFVSGNGLSPGRCQAIIWTNAGILLIGPLVKS